MAFVNKEFHSTTCYLFLINFIQNIFVLQNPTIFPSLLLANPDLRAEIESLMVIQYRKKGIFFLKWSNCLHKLLGNFYTYSCEFCHILDK